MASLSSLYSATGTSLPLDYVAGAHNETDARSDAGLQKSRMMQLYSQRALPKLRDRFASRGTFYSGSARRSADELTGDTAFDMGMIDRTLSRTLTGMQSQLALAAAGVGF